MTFERPKLPFVPVPVVTIVTEVIREPPRKPAERRHNHHTHQQATPTFPPQQSSYDQVEKIGYQLIERAEWEESRINNHTHSTNN